MLNVVEPFMDDDGVVNGRGTATAVAAVKRNIKDVFNVYIIHVVEVNCDVRRCLKKVKHVVVVIVVVIIIFIKAHEAR